MHIDIPPSLLARADKVIELVRPLRTDIAADAQVSSWHRPTVRAASRLASGIWGSPDVLEALFEARADDRA